MLSMLSVYVHYLFSYLDRDDGQDFIEYALIIALIVIAGIVGMSALGGQIAGIWGSIQATLGGAIGG
jgi:Flp pilus assembly pilin Flp